MSERRYEVEREKISHAFPTIAGVPTEHPWPNLETLQGHLDDIDARLEALEERTPALTVTGSASLQCGDCDFKTTSAHAWDEMMQHIAALHPENATSPSGKPEGELVERVAQAMGLEAQEARNAIREIADWLECLEADRFPDVLTVRDIVDVLRAEAERESE
jgi:hypothetical protein